MSPLGALPWENQRNWRARSRKETARCDAVTRGNSPVKCWITVLFQHKPDQHALQLSMKKICIYSSILPFRVKQSIMNILQNKNLEFSYRKCSPRELQGSMSVCLVSGHEIVFYFFPKCIFVSLSKEKLHLKKKASRHLLIFQHEHLY